MDSPVKKINQLYKIMIGLAYLFFTISNSFIDSITKMQKTIYKWSQYYLMYSPVWRLLTSQSVISKQNFSDSRRDKAQKPKENKFEVTSIAERPKAI